MLTFPAFFVFVFVIGSLRTTNARLAYVTEDFTDNSDGYLDIEKYDIVNIISDWHYVKFVTAELEGEIGRVPLWAIEFIPSKPISIGWALVSHNGDPNEFSYKKDDLVDVYVKFIELDGGVDKWLVTPVEQADGFTWVPAINFDDFPVY